MSTALVEKTAQMVQEKFKNESTGHDWEHIRRVWIMAQRICRKEKADFETVELAALLHDISDWKENYGNSTTGADEARRWLVQNNANPILVEHVSQIVSKISFKGSQKPEDMPTLEGKITQDADRLESLGAIGIIRAISFGASKNRILYDPAIPPKSHLTNEVYVQRTINPKDDTTINHFYEKLLLVKDRLHTHTAKKIAQHRHEYIEQFLEEFLSEWEGKK